MKIGTTGTRQGMTTQQLLEVPKQLMRLGAHELHHGDCIGSDQQFHAIARTLGLHVVGHPPKASGLRALCECDELRAPREFLVRNHAIVLETQILVATPEGPARIRSGTWSTIRFAHKMNLPYIIIAPDGSITNNE